MCGERERKEWNQRTIVCNVIDPDKASRVESLSQRGDVGRLQIFS